jgi:hypothetical protein
MPAYLQLLIAYAASVIFLVGIAILSARYQGDAMLFCGGLVLP